MDSLKIGTLSAEIASFSGFVPIKGVATQFGRLRLNSNESPCHLVLCCELRGDWPISPSKFHAYLSYRSVHWLVVNQWYWDLYV